jgi:hypothetical protein
MKTPFTKLNSNKFFAKGDVIAFSFVGKSKAS